MRLSPQSLSSMLIPVPKEFLRTHKVVALCADIIFINKLPFLVTISSYIGFTTIEYLKDRTNGSISHSLTWVLKVYSSRGFSIGIIHVDNEFSFLVPIFSVPLNTTSKSENVPLVERQIRVIKERLMAIIHTLPFKCIPCIIVIDMDKICVKWLNVFFWKNEAFQPCPYRYYSLENLWT